MNKHLSEWFSGFFISAFAYATLFYLNGWLTQYLVYDLGVSWIYLPAGLRLFLTLIFGFPGALGIGCATFLLAYYGDFSQNAITCIGVGLISGFAPYIARFFILTNIRIAPDLSDLNLPKLVICIVIYALLSAGLHQYWFATRGLDHAGTVNDFLVMFVGDVFGTVLLVAAIKYGLDGIRQFKKTMP